MKQYKSIFIFLIFAFATLKIVAQANPSIAVIGLGTYNPNNVGEVVLGSTLDLQITVGNTGTANIVAFKLRPVITVPGIVTFLPDAQQTGLPAGWSIVSNSGSQMRICNGTDVIAGSESRTIILKVTAVSLGGPSTFAGQMNFGGASCAAAGPAPSGNVTADDNATSTITVVSGPLPLTLVSFNASVTNCKPLLNWITESEINTDRFEIERNDVSNASAGWKTTGEVKAKGTLPKSTYNFLDAAVDAGAEKLLYRLKIIDKDGSYKYSDVLPVSLNCKTTQVSIYPNPVKDGRVHVSLSGAAGITQAVLMSAAGQQMLKAKITNGSNYLNVSAIADGVYYLHIIEANGTEKKIKLLIKK